MARERTAAAPKARVKALEQEVKALNEELWAQRIEPTRWVTERCIEEFGLEVQAGPFAGLRYPRELVGRVDALVPKLIGAYELEVHAAVRSMIAQAPETVVNVGAAEGFYAVGMARAVPGARVLAYDTAPEKQADCARLAQENGVVDRVTIGGTCTASSLATLEPGACVFLDCEGCELDLISEEAMPGLRQATLLVELHDAVDLAVTGPVLARLEPTHTSELMTSGPRNIDDYPELSFLGWNNRQIAIWEFRPRPMRWALLRPRSA
jgi:precorrin-6B methylase 2